MLADRDKLNELGLRRFAKDFDNIESQYMNLIYDPMFNRVVERWVYEKTIGMMEWTCAICGKPILSDRGRSDVENFVCDTCKEKYNNKSPVVHTRTMNSTTKTFKHTADTSYEQLADKFKADK